MAERVPDLRPAILSAWRTNNRITGELIERLPDVLWNASVPGVPRRTIRMIAAHLHNARRSWIRTLGSEHGVPVPDRVDQRVVSRRQLVAALKRSNRGMEALLELGLALRLFLRRVVADHDGGVAARRASDVGNRRRHGSGRDLGRRASAFAARRRSIGRSRHESAIIASRPSAIN
jgi:hypothetical protein